MIYNVQCRIAIIFRVFLIKHNFINPTKFFLLFQFKPVRYLKILPVLYIIFENSSKDIYRICNLQRNINIEI